MRLEAFISELLYEHDCVVLPDFGGLVANYRTARLNRRTHIISPPSKHIGFNRHVMKNDMLLINKVSSSMQISMKDAALVVENAISDYKRELDGNGRLVLEKIGIFFRDKGGQLQFIPDEQENYLLSSFGLTPVQLRPVIAPELQKPVADETPVVSIQHERRKVAGWKVAAAVALPLLLAGTFMVNSRVKREGHFSFASLNPFHEVRINASYRPEQQNWQSPEVVTADNDVVRALESADDVTKYNFVTGAVDPEGITIRKEKHLADAVSTDVKPEAQPAKDRIDRSHKQGRYAIIGGAFQIKENAENFLDKLKSEGFEAEMAGTKDGLQLVAYGFYQSREEARRALNNIKSSGGHAWIRQY